MLQNCSSERIFENEFLKVLVQGYWEQNSKIIIRGCFIPWLAYLTCTMSLFAVILKPEEPEEDEVNHAVKYGLSFITLLMIMVQISIEYSQVQNESGFCQGFKDHFLKG